MARTREQLEAADRLRTLAARYKVEPDAQGWPVIPGRLGRIEWYCDGIDCHSCPLPGRFALAVYTVRPRIFGRLWSTPGVRRHQTGDTEMRAVFTPEALPQVARVIRARRRRALTPEQARTLGAGTAYRATSATRNGPLKAGVPTGRMPHARPLGRGRSSIALRQLGEPNRQGLGRHGED
jgi:hypothetical protein